MGFVGFTYLIIFLVILYYVILLAILAGGFALFYWGLRSHRKPENEKKAWPIILKISGITIMAFMLVAIVTKITIYSAPKKQIMIKGGLLPEQ